MAGREDGRLLEFDQSSGKFRQLEKLLAFFGVSYSPVTAESLQVDLETSSAPASAFRLFCTAQDLLALLSKDQGGSDSVGLWSQHVHSVFVHSGDTLERVSSLLCLLNSGTDIPVHESAIDSQEWLVSSALEGFAGAMGGVRVMARATDGTTRVATTGAGTQVASLISAGRVSFFVMLRWHGVPIFVCLSENMIDLDRELDTPNFDIRDHLFSALPIVLYLRWAFPSTAWHAPEAGACVIIDDPLLKPRYGFLRFKVIADAMERHNFSTNIAFIPWNCRRSAPDTVRLFTENPERLSLSVHGCDHTAAEFGESNAGHFRPMIAASLERMSEHQERTAITHSPIMVFPQGVFTKSALTELKRANFMAAVNTEIMPNGNDRQLLTVADAWDTAVRAYGDFALFTRRYPRQGVENLAFDLLLGKPCLIVIHHDFCQGDCQHLVAFVKRLHALPTKLVWRSLGEVLRRSYRTRELKEGTYEVEMYGTEIRLENASSTQKGFQIKFREKEPSMISEISSDSEPLIWTVGEGYIHFETRLQPGASKLITIRFAPPERQGKNGRHQSGLKIGLRRYLCEVRDNYVVPIKARLAARFSRS